MDSLSREENLRDLKNTLQRLPSDRDLTYEQTLLRIQQQTPGNIV